jgi:hypothetical protein
MSKHTPGPWKRCVGSGAVEIRGGPVGNLTHPRVCRVLRTDPNCDANARLIAAAPDLLAALERLVRQHGSDDVTYTGDHPIAVARAAIHKAIGVTP